MNFATTSRTSFAASKQERPTSSLVEESRWLVSALWVRPRTCAANVRPRDPPVQHQDSPTTRHRDQSPCSLTFEASVEPVVHGYSAALKPVVANAESEALAWLRDGHCGAHPLGLSVITPG